MIVKSILTAFSELLRPLVRVLVRYGIPYRTALGILRSVYITESERELSRPNKRATISSISVITGLPRSEISKHMHDNEIAEQLKTIPKHNKAACILKVWSEDDKYQDPQGKPKALPITGYGDSFADLVKKHAGTVPYQSILDELVRTGCVKINPYHEIELQRSDYACNEQAEAVGATLYEFKDEARRIMESYSTRLLAHS